MNVIISANPCALSTERGQSSYNYAQLKTPLARIVDSDPAFRRLRDRIESFELAKADWDDEDGLPASRDVTCLAVAIARESAIAARDLGITWTRPSSSLQNDGGIAIFWETPHLDANLVVGPGDDEIRATLMYPGGYPASMSIPRKDALDFIAQLAKLIFAA